MLLSFLAIPLSLAQGSGVPRVPSSVGSTVQLDNDGDGFGNEVDVCPLIPASKSSNGCPEVFFRPQKKGEGSPVYLWFQKTNSPVRMRQQTQLRKGDRIEARVLDLVTDEIYSKSQQVEVR